MVTACRLRLVPRLASACHRARVVRVGRRRDRRRGPLAAGARLAGGGGAVRRRRPRAGVRDVRPARPFTSSAAAYVLVEAADHRDPTGDLADAVAAASGVVDVAVAADSAAAGRPCGAIARSTPLAINTLGPPHKMDVTLPRRRMAEFVDEVGRVVAGVRPTRGHGSSGTSATATCTSTSPASRPTTRRSTTPCLQLRGVDRRQHQRRARHRHGQAALAAPESLPRRDRRDAGHQDAPSTPPASSTRTCSCRVDPMDRRHRVVVIGAGFGGLAVAKGLADQPVDVTWSTPTTTTRSSRCSTRWPRPAWRRRHRLPGARHLPPAGAT